MQKIDGNTILLNRGDALSFNLKLEKEDGSYYLFLPGDKITFSIYKKSKMNDNAVLLKEINATANTDTLTITCTSEETKIGELINKPVDYWYEIELNDEYTVLGYDENGPKILKLYPEGSKIE